jgi:hypothetical protein
MDALVRQQVDVALGLAEMIIGEREQPLLDLLFQLDGTPKPSGRCYRSGVTDDGARDRSTETELAMCEAPDVLFSALLGSFGVSDYRDDIICSFIARLLLLCGHGVEDNTLRSCSPSSREPRS